MLETAHVPTQNVRHLVLEVLSCDERVQKLPTTLNHGVNFSTASSEVGVVVEGFPQVVDRLATGLRTSINEDTNLGLRASVSMMYINNPQTSIPQASCRSR